MPPLIRDRKYLDWLRTQPCLITGLRATETMGVDPVHIGTAGNGVKSGDDCALPIKHDIHGLMHHGGEITVLRTSAPDYILRMAFRALAREMYQQWKAEQ